MKRKNRDYKQFEMYIIEEELESWTHDEFLLISKKERNINRKWAKYVNRYITEKETQMVNKHRKRCAHSNL